MPAANGSRLPSITFCSVQGSVRGLFGCDLLPLLTIPAAATIFNLPLCSPVAAMADFQTVLSFTSPSFIMSLVMVDHRPLPARMAKRSGVDSLTGDVSTAMPVTAEIDAWRQATSEDEPAQATVTAGAHSVGGSPTAELEMQSHPSPYTPPHHAAPQPAVAVVMPSGATTCVPMISSLPCC